MKRKKFDGKLILKQIFSSQMIGITVVKYVKT